MRHRVLTVSCAHVRRSVAQECAQGSIHAADTGNVVHRTRHSEIGLQMMSSPFGATRIAVALMVVVMLALPHSGRAQTAIIVNRSNPVASLSLDDLRRLYLGTSTTFSNSVPVSLLEMTGLRASF